jgi:hypothetical protein
VALVLAGQDDGINVLAHEEAGVDYRVAMDGAGSKQGAEKSSDLGHDGLATSGEIERRETNVNREPEPLRKPDGKE